MFRDGRIVSVAAGTGHMRSRNFLREVAACGRITMLGTLASVRLPGSFRGFLQAFPGMEGANEGMARGFLRFLAAPEEMPPGTLRKDAAFLQMARAFLGFLAAFEEMKPADSALKAVRGRIIGVGRWQIAQKRSQ